MKRSYIPAYIDSFAGLIPCEVLHIEKSEHGFALLTVQVTSVSFNRCGYLFGEIIHGSGRSVVPRDRIKVFGGKKKVLPYNWLEG